MAPFNIFLFGMQFMFGVLTAWVVASVLISLLVGAWVAWRHR
jgi:hypothetical protein